LLFNHRSRRSRKLGRAADVETVGIGVIDLIDPIDPIEDRREARRSPLQRGSPESLGRLRVDLKEGFQGLGPQRWVL
jgi:hypothetical protein